MFMDNVKDSGSALHIPLPLRSAPVVSPPKAESLRMSAPIPIFRVFLIPQQRRHLRKRTFPLDVGSAFTVAAWGRVHARDSWKTTGGTLCAQKKNYVIKSFHSILTEVHVALISQLSTTLNEGVAH